MILLNNNCFPQSPYGEGLIENRIKNQKLKKWQIEIAKKENKNILDYYLILFEKLLVGEEEITNDTKEYRLIAANNRESPFQGRVNIKAGYLIASPIA